MRSETEWHRAFDGAITVCEGKMKLALSTLPWGFVIERVEPVLRIAELLQFSGIEFSQRPDATGVKSGRELRSLSDNYGLAVLGCDGGTLRERVRFFKESQHHAQI